MYAPAAVHHTTMALRSQQSLAQLGRVQTPRGSQFARNDLIGPVQP
ncbi:hypothetical protein [Kibdelosporangium philippinense]